ncbi:MAG: NAD(P)/FAD-dependent oxidoreductase [Clostridia bacterium]|nr:NAD(P)/FAD-dependent oxidoreductase [Clostridia bacterium]
MLTTEYDGIVIGAGPNGLTLAAYLVKAGLKVLLIEKRFEIGGGLATEQVTIPGFLHNTHAIYMPMVDYAPAFQDLELDKVYDLKFVHPPLVMAMPLADGRFVGLYRDVEKTCQSLAQFSKNDAAAYRDLYHKFRWMMDEYLGPATYMLPKPTFEAVLEMEHSEVGRAIAEIRIKSPKTLIEEWFEDDHVRTLMLYAACMWGLEYDLDGISFLVPLLLDRAVNYRLCVGGSHHLAHLLYKFICENGGRVLTSQLVKRIVVEDGKATGVELEDGRIFKAKNFVASSLDPHQTFLKLVDPATLDQGFVQRVKDWQWEEISLFDVHLALTEPPRFKAAANNPELNEAFIYLVGYESEAELIEHWNAIRRGELIAGGFNCCFPTVHDPSQAPKGRHTGLLSQHAPYKLKDGGGEKWYTAVREEHAQRCLEVLRRYAPNINEDTILWYHVSTPLDIENKFADMVRGSIKQGAYTPLQMGFMRPNEYCSQYRTPIAQLYVCGASVYPGGLILLGGGYNCANVIAEDLGLEKWWREPEMITRAREKGVL